MLCPQLPDEQSIALAGGQMAVSSSTLNVNASNVRLTVE